MQNFCKRKFRLGTKRKEKRLRAELCLKTQKLPKKKKINLMHSKPSKKIRNNLSTDGRLNFSRTLMTMSKEIQNSKLVR